MALRPKTFYRGQPGTTVTTLFNGPSVNNYYIIVKNIFIHNTSSGAVNIKLYNVESGGSAANSNKFFDADIAPNGTVLIDSSMVVESQAFLAAVAGAEDSISLNISGVEYSL